MSIYLRRRQPLPADVDQGRRILTRDELRRDYGADPQDVEALRRELGPYGITVGEVDLGARRVVAHGTVGQFAEAFRLQVRTARTTHRSSGQPVEHRFHLGSPTPPDRLGDAIVAVLGIDNRPQASAKFRFLAKEQAPASLTVPQVGAAYGFPAGADGTGRALAIIELGGGFNDSDLDQFFGGLGLATPSVTAVPVDGAANAPTGTADGPDGEVALDIEVAGALAPGAAQYVYFAPNTDQGFTDAVSAAAHATPTPTAISISWGGPEDSWSAQSLSALDSACADAVALGVTVLVAAGDNGSSDGASDGAAQVDFPASSPHVVACGGTRLTLDASGAIAAETVWNDGTQGGATGGGVSVQFPLPAWQQGAGVPPVASSSGTTSGDGASGNGGNGGDGMGEGSGGVAHPEERHGHRHHHHHRAIATDPAAGGDSGTGTGGDAAAGSGSGGRGVPDVAGNADPETGYDIYVDGQAGVVGGTSAVAPLWAALVCRLAQQADKQLGLIQNVLYQGVQPGVAQRGLHDVTSGDNGAYSAGPGWDACTGLGTPDGATLSTLFS